MKKTTNLLQKMLCFTMLLLVSQAFAQSGVLSGTVTDTKGNALIGANVSAGSKSATTNENGSYTLSGLAEGKTTVTVTFIGYKTVVQEVSIKGATTANLQMEDESKSLDEVVVTGVVRQRAKLQSSVSVSSVNTAQIEQAAPRSTAEIFRSIAGIKAEPTGGEGNANITVRGIPIASGGAKFLQLHEDGLPVMQFGDVAFGNADIFVRNDQTLARVEAIRGGSASTLASNSPAGIINFISKDGKKEGGTLMQQVGVDFGQTRTDFEYGSPLSESLRFDVGGF
jgi:outer membrane receptor protein involved in Fe transport